MATRRTAKREDTSPKEGESKYGDVAFADEKNKKYPIDTEEHIRAAWNYINKEKNAGEYSAEDVKAIKAKIVAAWKDKIDKEGPPSAAEERAASDDATLANGWPVIFRRAVTIELNRTIEPTPEDQLRRSLGNPTATAVELLTLAQRHLANDIYNALVKADATGDQVREALQKVVERAGPPLEDISMAISSETPIDDGYGPEVLDHGEGCDLSYAANGLPLRVTDSTSSHEPGEQVGILENCAIGADRVLRGRPRFSRSAKGQEIRQDVLDGIRRNLSVGGFRRGVISRSKNGVTRMAWAPVETTIVPVPADLQVGVGRSAREAADQSRIRSEASAAAPTGQERTMPEDAAARAAGNGGAAAGAVVEIEGSEAAKIARICRQEKCEERLAEYFEKNMDYADVCIDIAERRIADQVPPIQRPAIELTDKERKQYSFRRGILAMADRSEGRKADSFELDVHKDLEKRWPEGVARNGGLIVPTFTSKQTLEYLQRRQRVQRGEEMIERAGLDSATSTAGTELKFNVPGEFLVALRNKMIVMEAGAELMGGLVGPIVFPYQDGVGSATWVGENPGVDVGDSNLTLTTYTLRPNTLQSSTSYSRQLLAQSSYDVDAMVRNDLALIMATEIDRAAINGSGAGAEPTGLLQTTGVDVTTVAGGVAGAPPTFANLVDLETVVGEANADIFPGLAYLTTPGMRGVLKKAVAVSNTVALPVWTSPGAEGAGADAFQGGGSRARGEANGYPAWASNNVPHALTKGVTAGSCHAIIFGAWSKLCIGDWGMFEMIVDPYRLKKQGMIELTTFQMVGIVVKYPAAFAAMVDGTKS